MDELPPAARALLDASQHADDPTAAERARSDDTLRAALARYGVNGLPPLQHVAGSSSAGRPAKASFTRASLAMKIGAGALVVVAAAFVGMRVMSPGRPKPRPAPPQLSAAAPPDSAARVSSSGDAPVARPSAPSAEKTASTAIVEPVQRHLERPVPATGTHKPVARRAASGEDNQLQAELRTVATVNELVRHKRYADALQLLEGTDTEAAAVLREERAALRIIARCAQAPDERARHERDQFLLASSRSVLSDRVRSACASTVVERP